MKQTGQCPKCESSDIWNNSHIKRRTPPLKKWILVRFSGLMGFNRKFAYQDEYVCMNCGYSETFIEEEGLKTIREYGFTEVER